MLETATDNSYKDLSAMQEIEMAERITAVASKGSVTITRLVAGVELALKQSGKHWTLSTSKKG